MMRIAAVLVLGLLACSGGDEGTPPADAGGVGGAGGSGPAASLPDPCTLLSPMEWAPLMDGTPMVEPRSGAMGPVSVNRCDWTHRQDGTRRQFSNLAVATAGAYGMNPGSMSLAIGDQGYINAIDNARTLDIGWKKGALSATFKYSALVLPAGKAWADVKDAAIALARQAAGRMP